MISSENRKGPGWVQVPPPKENINNMTANKLTEMLKNRVSVWCRPFLHAEQTKLADDLNISWSWLEGNTKV